MFLKFCSWVWCCWEGLRAGGRGDDRGWDGWMASPTRWTWVWVNSGSWWWTGRPGVLRFMGSQRVRHDWATELTDWWCLLWSHVDTFCQNKEIFLSKYLLKVLKLWMMLTFIKWFFACIEMIVWFLPYISFILLIMIID